MSARSIILWVCVPFLALCALGLWLTRPPADTPRLEPRALPPAPAAPRSPPGPTAPTQAAVPPASPGEPPHPAPPPRRMGSPLPSRSLAPPPIEIPEAEPREEARTGTVEKEEIRQAISAVVPLIRQCFQDIAERYPGSHSVTLRFTLEGQGPTGEGQGLTGHLRDGEVAQTTIQDPHALACFLDSLLDVRFPPPRGGGRVTLSYPFRFVPKPNAGR